MKILLAHPGTAFSTIDVSLGYEAALKHDHRVDVFDYNQRLLFYDTALDAWEKLTVYKKGGGDVQAMAGEALVIQAIDMVPDAVIVVSGLAYHPRAFDMLYRLDVPLFLMLTECPYIDQEQINLVKASHAVGVFANDLMSIKSIWEATGVTTCYLPHSYDPGKHYYRDVEEEYQSDVFFFGTMWPERQEMFRPLIDHPNGWRVDVDGTRFGNGKMESKANEELALRYCGTKIAINHHRTVIRVKDDDLQHIPAYGAAYSIGPRAYEIAACGAFQLCDDTRPELRDVFGDSVATYTDKADLMDKIGYYLAHDQERREMASAAHEKVKSCSFRRRADEIVIPYIEEVLNGRTVSR